MPRRSIPRRPRALAFVGAVAFASALTMMPPSPVVEPALARGPHAHLATHESRLVSAGRIVVRDLARRTFTSRVVTAPAPPARLSWDRAARRTAAADSTTSLPTARPSGGATAPASATLAMAVSGPAGTRFPADPIVPADVPPATIPGPGVVGTAWNGLTDQALTCNTSRPCFEPADPWIAVSATHVVQAVNQAIRITDRNGSGGPPVANAAFFGTSAWKSGAFVADPRVLFDPGHGRWIATLFAGTCSGGALFLAVSQGADPTLKWDTYFLEFAGAWPDFPTLGYSSTLVAVGVNQFAVSCGAGGSYSIGAYKGASLHVMDWADLLDGGGSPTIASTSPVATSFSYVPAAGLTAGDPIQAAVALADGSAHQADLGYVSISGTVGGGTLAVAAPVVLTTALGEHLKLQDPPTPIDAGGLIGVQHNALDLRPTDAAWLDGRLAVASTTSCLRGTTSRPCARVVELTTQADLSTPALRQDLLLAPTPGYTDTFTPGVGYSDDGTLWTVFSQGGAARYVSSWARRQIPGAAPGTWSPGVALVAAGRGPYGGTAGAGLNERWGDYVGVARDPAEAGSVWQANQMADTGGGWATRVARLGDDTTAPALGAPRPGFMVGYQAGTRSVPVRISWSQSDGGSGVASVRLERSLNGGAFVPVALTSSTANVLTLNVAYGARYSFRVTATDNAGNSSGWTVGPSFTPMLYSQSSSIVSYTGRWAPTFSPSFLGGSARYANGARRRATVTFTGLAVAWVTTTARTRGSARVYADGVLQGTYSTYRSLTTYRRMVTARTFPTSGRHRFTIEVVGTAHHPRVDVDAFVVLR